MDTERMPWAQMRDRADDIGANARPLGDTVVRVVCGNMSRHGNFAYSVTLASPTFGMDGLIHAYHGRLWTGLPPVLFQEASHVMVVPFGLKMHALLKGIPRHDRLTQWCPALVWEA